MSDTKDASHTSKDKIVSSRWGSSLIPSRWRPFFLVVSENIAASSASFLQAVLASVGVREQLVASSAG